MKKWIVILFITACLLPGAYAKKAKKKAEEENEVMTSATFSGLKCRSIGPALTSGRIADFAMHPENRFHFYVAVCSGGVWETKNAGTTWTPLFDKEGSYSIGCIAIDRNNPNILWVGTGENNSQRSVAYGDGLYKSEDGGKSWKHLGLKESEHIGKILIHPGDSNIVYVAVQGPLWNAGGDRGLYKTTDGGQTFEKVLDISPHTGVTDLVMDPRDPDTLYAASYQRRRHVWTLINGGPESTIHKTTDGGKTWKKVNQGLPAGDIGRIGLAMAPSDPEKIYAIVEAEAGKGGFYLSTNAGASWTRQNKYVASSPQYYQEIVVDPKDSDTIYSLDTYLHRSIDGGKTFQTLNKNSKHVDNHALWIDPDNTQYLLIGCDGGIYESFDKGVNWKFMANLPVTQFYRITADNSFPFYFVYGGTQDNFSLGAPSQTTSVCGITNADWFVTLGGDGYKSQIDPKDPNTIYAQYQYGGLARYDKKSGERVYIQPQPSLDDKPLKWNWNSPLIISPHNHTRLYYGSNVLFRSDDRGNSWQKVSPDLTRQVDRNQLKVMDRVWPIDAVAKNKSTSFYGSLVSLTESALVEGLIYGGTDDGLIQVTSDGGQNWVRYDNFPNVPQWTYVSALVASRHSENRVYAAFDNHKKGDYKPYILVSEDRGKSWQHIEGNLPQKGTVYCLAEDHLMPELLFAGTEFGVFFTSDRGKTWVQLKAGMPTIAVRDLSIQERENDLVIATFGRGIYILDNYQPLRELTEAVLNADHYFAAVKDCWQYIVTNPLGYAEKGQQGDAFFNAKNPEYGAVLTYYLKDSYETSKQKRKKREKELVKEGKNPGYPSWEELEKEKLEKGRQVYFEISNAEGEKICRIKGPGSKGVHRVAWNLRYPGNNPAIDSGKKKSPHGNQNIGFLCIPGTYSASMFIQEGDEVKQVGSKQEFKVLPLGKTTFPAKDQQALLSFRKASSQLQSSVRGVRKTLKELKDDFKLMEKVVFQYPNLPANLKEDLKSIKGTLRDMEKVLYGNRLVQKHSEATLPGLMQRVNWMAYSNQGSLSAPTQTQTETFKIIQGQFNELVKNLTQLKQELQQFNQALDRANVPWTPGRTPVWPE